MKKILGALVIVAGVGLFSAPSLLAIPANTEVPVPVVTEVVVQEEVVVKEEAVLLPETKVVDDVVVEDIPDKVVVDGKVLEVVADPSTGEPVLKYGPGHFSTGWTGPYHDNACPIRDERYETEYEWYSACSGMPIQDHTRCGCEIAGADGY